MTTPSNEDKPPTQLEWMEIRLNRALKFWHNAAKRYFNE